MSQRSLHWSCTTDNVSFYKYSLLCLHEVVCALYVCNHMLKFLCALFEPCGVLLALATTFVSVHIFMIFTFVSINVLFT